MSPTNKTSLAEHRVTVRKITKNRLRVEAIDGTPVVDIKPVLSGCIDA